MAKSSFPGFPSELIQFLDELSKHNNRKWFQANKTRYEDHVLEPSLAFIAAMVDPLAKVSPHFLAVPKRVGGSLMRIYRDVRFSKDKRPYKTNVGIHFRHAAGKDVHAPGFYFHIEPAEVFLGVGIWHPDAKTLQRIRQAIAADPAAWKRAKGGKAFRDRYALSGDSLKRPPQGYPTDHPLIEDLKRKDHIGLLRLERAALLEPGIVRETTDAFRAGKHYMTFLCRAIGVPY
ncbi:MAG: DUF2461 domain-containing protein [Planctomycetales bacterium]|nr:DUF2461 domain-containing protein [Planctomycetales bacterium]